MRGNLRFVMSGDVAAATTVFNRFRKNRSVNRVPEMD